MNDSLTLQLVGEFVGTLILILLGDGVVAAVTLKNLKPKVLVGLPLLLVGDLQ